MNWKKILSEKISRGRNDSAASARFHNLRSKQAQAEGRVHTVADTAVEVKGRSDGNFQNSVRKDIIVSNYLHMPEVG